MPAYDYRCIECRDVFEVVRPAADDSDVRCPSCDGPTKRVFTPVGVVFKGSGFHSTDYRKKPSDGSADKAPACPSADAESGTCSSCPASGGAD